MHDVCLLSSKKNKMKNYAEKMQRSWNREMLDVLKNLLHCVLEILTITLSIIIIIAAAVLDHKDKIVFTTFPSYCAFEQKCHPSHISHTPSSRWKYLMMTSPREKPSKKEWDQNLVWGSKKKKKMVNSLRSTKETKIQASGISKESLEMKMGWPQDRWLSSQ